MNKAGSRSLEAITGTSIDERKWGMRHAQTGRMHGGCGSASLNHSKRSSFYWLGVQIILRLRSIGGAGPACAEPSPEPETDCCGSDDDPGHPCGHGYDASHLVKGASPARRRQPPVRKGETGDRDGKENRDKVAHLKSGFTTATLAGKPPFPSICSRIAEHSLG